MSKAIIKIYMNITNSVLINKLEKERSVTETHRLKYLVIFIKILCCQEKL